MDINTEKFEDAFPKALRELRTRRYVAASFILLAAVVLAVLSGNARCMLIALLAFWLFYMGFSLQREYSQGLIKDELLICAQVHVPVTGKRVELVFCSDGSSGQEEKFYNMRYEAGKRAGTRFITGARYRVFFDDHDPANIIAYELL